MVNYMWAKIRFKVIYEMPRSKSILVISTTNGHYNFASKTAFGDQYFPKIFERGLIDANH